MEVITSETQEGTETCGAVATAMAETVASTVKVYLVEDHVVFRTQLARMISKDQRIVVCGESDNITEALPKIEETRPDLVIVDIMLQGINGLELIKKLKWRSCSAALLVLSIHEESVFAERALRAGASGYVNKIEASTHLHDAIQCVLEGGIFLSTRMTTKLVQKMGKEQKAPLPACKDFKSLSRREQEVFYFLGKGRTTREIAQELHLQERTVQFYRHQITLKLGIRNAAELYTMAARWVED